MASFIEFCLLHHLSQPPDKIVKNLCTFLCQDDEQTPTFAYMRKHTDGILTYQNFISTSSKTEKEDGKEKDKTKLDEFGKAHLSRRGASLAFEQLSAKFGSRLLEVIPTMWQSMAGGLLSAFNAGLFYTN